jgi:hypothetical protein
MAEVEHCALSEAADDTSSRNRGGARAIHTHTQTHGHTETAQQRQHRRICSIADRCVTIQSSTLDRTCILLYTKVQAYGACCLSHPCSHTLVMTLSSPMFLALLPLWALCATFANALGTGKMHAHPRWNDIWQVLHLPAHGRSLPCLCAVWNRKGSAVRHGFSMPCFNKAAIRGRDSRRTSLGPHAPCASRLQEIS